MTTDLAFSSEGQRLLSGLGLTVQAVADRVGTTRQAVSYWRRGEKLPASSVRAKLLAAYGIPIESWDRRPGDAGATTSASAIPSPGTSSSSTTGESTLALVMRRQVIYAGMVEDPGLSAADRLRAGGLEAKMIDARRQLERDARLLERDVVQRTAAWATVRRRTIDTLRAFPDALRAWVDAMGELVQESAPQQGALDAEDEEEPA